MNKKIILAIILGFAVGFFLIILGSIGLWLGLRLRETTPEEVTGQGNNTGTATPTTETTHGILVSYRQIFNI